MTDTYGMSTTVFYVNGGIIVVILILLHLFRAVRRVWLTHTVARTVFALSILYLFWHWAVLPIEKVGDGISFLDQEDPFLNIWKYYWIDWGMRLALFPLLVVSYGALIGLGGVWPLNWLPRLGYVYWFIGYGLITPLVYYVFGHWALLPLLTS